MKRIIFLFVFGIMSLVSFGQETEQDLNKNQIHCIACDCHGKYLKHAIAFKRFNDTIIYISNDVYYNDLGEIKIIKDHYKKFNESDYDKYNYYSFETEDKFQLNSLEDLTNKYKDLTASDFCYLINSESYDKLQNKVKNGYIKDWSWNTNSVNGIDFNITYVNTNKKTIKYIDIYFIIKNPVKDICRILYNNGSNTCHLRCVGPIEEFHSGTYSWDACYYTTGDASNLHFTKFVITYMDNTKYTLVKELTYKED